MLMLHLVLQLPASITVDTLRFFLIQEPLETSSLLRASPFLKLEHI